MYHGQEIFLVLFEIDAESYRGITKALFPLGGCASVTAKYLTSVVTLPLPKKWVQDPFDLEREFCRKRSVETGLNTSLTFCRKHEERTETRIHNEIYGMVPGKQSCFFSLRIVCHECNDNNK